jgi:hypothetical protein
MEKGWIIAIANIQSTLPTLLMLLAPLTERLFVTIVGRKDILLQIVKPLKRIRNNKPTPLRENKEMK